MTSDKNTSERFEFVGELLNGEELLERLAGAQDVVASLNSKINGQETKIEALRRELKKRDRTLENLAVTMRDIARDLARAGGQTHKDKDEVLLIAIYRLLAHGNEPVVARDMDDIPWHDDLPF